MARITNVGCWQHLCFLQQLDAQAGIALDDAFGNGVTGQSGDIVNAKLVHHLLPVFLNRLDADAQFGGDLFVRPAFGNQLEHLCFPGGQVIRATSDRLSAGEGFAALVTQSLGDGRTEIALPLWLHESP